MILLSAFLLVAATVSVHVAGLTFLVERFARTEVPLKFGAIFRFLFPLAWALILIHTFEITVWAAFYWWRGCLPTFEAAWYFAGTTYTTVGFGDVVLIDRYRLLGPIEGLTGILMCGFSGALFFALSSRAFLSKRIER